MDGFTAIKEIMITAPTPIVVATGSTLAGEVATAMHALRAGALAVLRKPPAPGSPGFDEAARKLIATVKAMAQVKVVRHWRLHGPADAGGTSVLLRASAVGAVRPRLVAVATSTGGPAALQTLLSGLPGDFAAPILVVQHITAGFTAGLATWLNTVCDLQVKVAEHGERLAPHTVYVAPDDRHLGVSNQARRRAVDRAARRRLPARPGRSSSSRSARVFGSAALAVILTGMGDDGVAGLRAVRQAGGRIIAQDEETSVVFGMPGAAVAAGLADQVLPLDRIAGRAGAARRSVGAVGCLRGHVTLEIGIWTMERIELHGTHTGRRRQPHPGAGDPAAAGGRRLRRGPWPGSGREALAALPARLPDVVLTDLDMPEMNGLELVEAVRRDFPAVPVILMTALGSEEIAVEALQKGAASYVPKRNLRRRHPGHAGQRPRRRPGGARPAARLRLPGARPSCTSSWTTTRRWRRRSSACWRNRRRACGSCDRHDLMRVGVALHEALLNAIHHGNLELSSELRQEGDEKDYRDLAAVRRRQPPYRDRRVRVTAHCRVAEAVYVIEDERPRLRRLRPARPGRPGQRRPHRRPRPDAHPHLHGRGASTTNAATASPCVSGPGRRGRRPAARSTSEPLVQP